jgi:hypothetical protein
MSISFCPVRSANHQTVDPNEPNDLRPSTNHEDLERNGPEPIWLQDEEGDGFEPRRYSSRAKWPSALCRPNEGPRSEGQRSHRRTLMVPLATPLAADLEP